jgi:hypothetical protein
VGGFTISCLRQGTLGGIQAQVAGSAGEKQDWQGDLTTACTRALFRREVSAAGRGADFEIVCKLLADLELDDCRQLCGVVCGLTGIGVGCGRRSHQGREYCLHPGTAQEGGECSSW